MNPSIILITVVAYFILLFGISWFAGRKADNQGFFVGNRKSKWGIVAIATMGSFISGVTFVSVPGMVGVKNFSYLQMVMGFVPPGIFSMTGTCFSRAPSVEPSFMNFMGSPQQEGVQEPASKICTTLPQRMHL